jgi:hypothetical protein
MDFQTKQVEKRNNELLVLLKDHMLRKFSSYKKEKSIVGVFQKAKKMIKN